MEIRKTDVYGKCLMRCAIFAHELEFWRGSSAWQQETRETPRSIGDKISQSRDIKTALRLARNL